MPLLRAWEGCRRETSTLWKLQEISVGFIWNLTEVELKEWNDEWNDALTTDWRSIGLQEKLEV